MAKIKSTVPDNITEEYYQINPDILTSFPKYRPPIDLFEFKEDVAQLAPFFRKGQRLRNEQVEAIQDMCDAGILFVSRADHPVYSKHICKQLDLILVDENLKEAEISDIILQALQMRLEAFFEQPIQTVLDKLYTDILVTTQHLDGDPFRIKPLVRRLLPEHNLVNHSINSGLVGLWLYLKSKNNNYIRKEFDRTAVALFLHDMGMCKIPAFLLTKTNPLTPDERTKIQGHPIIGAQMAQKLGLVFDEIKMCVLEHHERLDGSGYPRKTKDREVSRLGRICALADSFCAMTTKRPHAAAMSPADAAQALVQDRARYDIELSRMLQSAFVTGQF